jgi:hypothetical protein
MPEIAAIPRTPFERVMMIELLHKVMKSTHVIRVDDWNTAVAEASRVSAQEWDNTPAPSAGISGVGLIRARLITTGKVRTREWNEFIDLGSA